MLYTCSWVQPVYSRFRLLSFVIRQPVKATGRRKALDNELGYQWSNIRSKIPALPLGEILHFLTIPRSGHVMCGISTPGLRCAVMRCMDVLCSTRG